MKKNKYLSKFGLSGLVFSFLVSPAFATVTVQIHASNQTVAVGTPDTFTAVASDSTNQNATFTYQFSVRFGSSGPFSVVKDYYYVNQVTWAPSDHEGSYSVQVIARSSTGAAGSAIDGINVTSLVTGNTPVVTATQNPLVALYSAPPCSAPSQVRVYFSIANGAIAASQVTPFKPCNGLSVNFYIAGMKQQTTYRLQQDLRNGQSDTFGPVVSFTTGMIPSTITFPTRTTLVGPTPPTSFTYPLVLQMPTYYPFATDLAGNIVWYLADYSFALNPNEQGYLFRGTNTGSFLGTQDDPSDRCPGSTNYCGDHQFFREFDLAGNIMRETNWTIINGEINALRVKNHKGVVHLNYFSHEGWRLPNGYTATMVTDEEVVDQGQGPVDVFGDIIIVLDTNLQVVWLWDAFDQLPVTRMAQLGNVCVNGQGGCPAIHLKQKNGQYYTSANDWTHCNSISYDPKDGNLVISSRHQSWVIKADYSNGTGDAHNVWILGAGGSFQLATGYNSDSWFSYQHDAQFQSNNVLTLFDNGDLRVSQQGGNSRGQGWSLDEVNLIATPVENVDLGVYAFAVGYATILSNGNYDFGASFVPGQKSFTFEFTPSNNQLVYEQEVVGLPFSYRPMRLPDLYTQR